MTIKLSGLEKFKNSVMALEARLDKRVTAKYQEVVTDILVELVANTPRWTGDLAASWKVVVGKTAHQTLPQTGHYTPFKRVDLMPKWETPRPVPGDSLGYAMLENAEAIYNIRWNSYVSIVNNSPTVNVGNPVGDRPAFLIDPKFAALDSIKSKYREEGMNLK